MQNLTRKNRLEIHLRAAMKPLLDRLGLSLIVLEEAWGEINPKKSQNIQGQITGTRSINLNSSAGGAYTWVRMTLYYLDKKFLKFTSANFTEWQIDQATRLLKMIFYLKKYTNLHFAKLRLKIVSLQAWFSKFRVISIPPNAISHQRLFRSETRWTVRIYASNPKLYVYVLVYSETWL